MKKKATSRRQWLAKYECEKTLVCLAMRNVEPMSPMWCWWYDYAVAVAVNIIAVKTGGWEPWK